jgi:hypothetical protein
VKSDRHKYKSQKLPLYQEDVGLAGWAGGSRRKESPEEYHSRYIGYDDLIGQRKKTFSRFKKELKKIRWLSRSSPHKSDAHDGSPNLDIGIPSWSEYDVGHMIHEATLVDMDAATIIEGEIPQYCELTMEKVFLERNKPPDRDIDKYSQKAGNHCLKTPHSMQLIQERCVPISWMSGQTVQRWSGVYSFSSTTCCTWKKNESKIVHRLNSGENKSTYMVMLRYLNRCGDTKMTIIMK